MPVTCGIWHDVLAVAYQIEPYPSIYATRISAVSRKVFKKNLVCIHSNSPMVSEKSLQQSDLSPLVPSA